MPGFERLTSLIDGLLATKPVVVLSLDGPCGSGKSTLAARLAEHFPGSCIIPADDFFPQPHQRTAERLAHPGGNLDRERLQHQVLRHLQSGQILRYQRYNCREDRLEDVFLPAARLYIVEGSYSQHPELVQFYDLKVFLDLDLDRCLNRLQLRVPPERLHDFTERWIPLEQAYFKAYGIRETSDFIYQA